MFHHWSQATDGTGAAVRVVLFDYRKAFDLIDHTILVAKINGLDMPRSIKAWVTDFLINRQQRVKLSADCFWGPSPGRGPTGNQTRTMALSAHDKRSQSLRPNVEVRR